LSCPPISTGDRAKSGKLAAETLAGMAIREQSQTVFGTRKTERKEPQGTDLKGFYRSKDAVATVHALSERRFAKGFGQKQVGLIEESANDVTGIGHDTGWR
jgi:hypothetical protein